MVIYGDQVFLGFDTSATFHIVCFLCWMWLLPSAFYLYLQTHGTQHPFTLVNIDSVLFCRDENKARKAAGEEPLPEEDPTNPIFKPIPEPSRLESFLVTNRIANYCNQINGYAINLGRLAQISFFLASFDCKMAYLVFTQISFEYHNLRYSIPWPLLIFEQQFYDLASQSVDKSFVLLSIFILF